MTLLQVRPALFFLTFCFLSSAQVLTYTIDLTSVENDQLDVKGEWTNTGNDSVLISFPAIVPGTYAKYDFGRFISEFSVTNENGEKIPFKKISQNQYGVKHKGKIYFSYKVEDTWDFRPNIRKKDKKNLPELFADIAEEYGTVFEPAGTNFEANKNFVLNNHGIFAFVYGKEHAPVKIMVHKPAGFYPATGLEKISIGSLTDTLFAGSYHQLVDSPVLYCLPDTAFIQIENTRVLVACYSPNKKIQSRYITRALQPILFSMKDYLGGKLPVNKYAFLFYFTDKTPLSGATGALEHNNSSFYSLFESDTSVMLQTIRDVCAHEFFHLITPLTIHSEQIANFNYIHPSMSQHLWLYEGLTEYASHHSQLLGGITDIDMFLNVILEKYQTSQNLFNDTMSFTIMSKNILNSPYKSQYSNVYEKGALINLCLDLTLLHLSKGEYGIRNLISDLSSRYGKNKSFPDDSLFDIITAMTYPEIRSFFRNYVEKGNPLPLAECIRYAGIVLHKEYKDKSFTLGSFGIDYNPKTQRFFVNDISNLDAFGKALGVKPGDELYSLNGKKLTGGLEDIEIIQNHLSTIQEGEMVRMQVYRPKNKKKKKFTLITLEAPATKVEIIRKNVVQLEENFSEEQKKILSAWTGISFR